MGWIVKAGALVVVAAQIGCFQKIHEPPPPLSSQCTDVSDPYSKLVSGAWLIAGDGGLPDVDVKLELIVPLVVGVGIDAVRVTGGTVIGIENRSFEGQYGDGQFYVIVAPDPGVLPDAGVVADGGFGAITIEVDFVCGTVTTTKQFQVMGPISPSAGLRTVEL